MVRPPRAVFVTLLTTALCVSLVSGADAVPGSLQTAQAQAPAVLAPAKAEGDVIERDTAARIDFCDVRETEHI